MSAFLTTKEVASLLRVKERKIYDMAAASEIPHRRITGKLLFPADEIEAWIDGARPSGDAIRPDICAGSHDPLLDWAVRGSGSDLATLFDGSFGGLERFAASQAALCGLHIPEPDGWNVETLSRRGVQGCVLIAWARRVQGLIVGTGNEAGLQGLADVGNRRIVLRQIGAGARELYDRLTADIDMSAAHILPQPARTEIDAALAVASGEADIALGLKAAADQYKLGFVPLVEERFDLLIDRRSYFTEPVQRLFAFTREAAFQDKAASLGGYDIAELGTVRWLST
ncbi:MAG: helix-turn-helix transcriptional regulator [Pseudomonadota bacterium]